jgi:hypothetical protein
MHLVMSLLLLQVQAAEPVPPPATSLDRIRKGLETPVATVTVESSNPDVPLIFRLEVRERPLPYEHLWQGDAVSAHVRPVRGLTHHEFLEQVTPDLFRATSMYPCCPVLPVINLLAKKLKTKERAQARARAEVKKALKEYQDALAAERKP